MQRNVNFDENLIWRVAENIFQRELNLAHNTKLNMMFFYQKITYILANNQDKTKENHNNDVYELNKNYQKVTRHKKIKIRVIKVRKK